MDAHSDSLLLVDTDAESLFSVAPKLSEQGYKVYSAVNVDQAISIGIREPIDILVSRYRLDVGTGNVLAMRLKTIKRLRDLSVLLMCQHQQAGVVLRTCGCLPEYSIRHPFDTGVLLELIHLTLETKRRRLPIPDQRATPADPNPVPLNKRSQTLPPPYAAFFDLPVVTPINNFRGTFSSNPSGNPDLIR